MAAIFNISGQHIEVTEPLATYAKDKLSKIEKVFPKTTNIHVVLSVEKKKKQQKAEAEVHLAGEQSVVFAEATTNDMYKSIDELESKLLRQVKKLHDKLTDHHRD